MSIDSPFVPEALQEKNRKLGRRLAVLILGLIAFSIAYIIYAN